MASTCHTTGESSSFAASPARAQTAPACADLSHPVYVAGSSAVQPFLGAVAAKLGAASVPVTVVYQKPGSCVGVGYMTSGTSYPVHRFAASSHHTIGLEPGYGLPWRSHEARL